jgi:2'-hydroxyisoflavone reductase
MSTRRQLLTMAASLAAGAAIARRTANGASDKTLLILTQAAQAAGWKVTHFNRGQTAADGVPGVETLIGDRKGKLDALRGRKWDAVVDDTGFIPKYVKMSAELLAQQVGYCLFISSVSVYAGFTKANDENSATGVLADPATETITDTTYGPMKALCEHYSEEAFNGRIAIVRPGYIVGPLDRSDRFTYWPVRASRGGEMLAPGTPRDPIQVIDVRDLAAFMMTLVASRTTGVYNAISPPRAFSMGDLVTACVQTSPEAHTRTTWVPENFLASHWKPEELDLPPWAPTKGEEAGFSLTATGRAQKAGLRTRALPATVRDTLTWFQTLPPERQAKLHAGLDPQKESDTLHAWHARA